MIDRIGLMEFSGMLNVLASCARSFRLGSGGRDCSSPGAPVPRPSGNVSNHKNSAKNPFAPAARKRRPRNRNALGFSCTMFLLVALTLFAAGCNRAATPDVSPNEPSATVAKFHCPMHPHYTSDKPGNCPICGMKLVPVNDNRAAVSATSIPGRVAIVVSAEKRNLIGLATSLVERRPLTRTLRNVGVVTHDETRLAKVAPRFGGWVQSLQVNYTGQPVEKGDPLFTAYSPELFTAENDYLLAWKNAQLSNSAPAIQKSADELLATARRKLELLQIGDAEIRALEQSGRPSDQLQLRAPSSGHVIVKNAVEGQAFAAGEMLYEISDLHHLWIRAAVYESDLPLIKVGQRARVTFLNLNNKSFETSVSFIYPHLDPQTRRAEVRLELENPRHEIRPEMWANVEIEVDLGEVTAIPASSVIDTGTRYIAFVDIGQDHLEPREVKIGAKTDDYYEVLDGLQPGEKVVTRALFLIDSESQLKFAISGMSEHQH